MKILIIGGGNMGMTYAKSFRASHIVTKENLYILEKSQEKAEEITKDQVGIIYGSPGTYISEADLIILAVKPQDTKKVFATIKPYIDSQQVILSIMAGIRLRTIVEALSCPKVVRAMPNLPAQIGLGMTVYTSSPDVTRIELIIVQNLLNATGKAVYVEDEEKIDAATAVSGSGPAYVFYFMQYLIKSAVAFGFSQAEAELLSYQTFRGAIDLYNKSEYSCEEWINKVASKGGTTEAALLEMDTHNLGIIFQNAVFAAKNRAEDLSKY